MNAFFFGNAKSALFGAYYPAQASAAGDRAVLLCGPAGQEYMRAHRAFHQLAGLLAARGFHVLRFDYTGTGDSAGDETAAGLAQWREDIAIAARELTDISGSAKPALVGLRLGAALALLTAETVAVERLVLWDPVVRGAAFLDELEALHRASLADRDRFQAPRTATAPEDEELLLGFRFPHALRRDLQGLDLLGRSIPAAEIALLVSEEAPLYARLHAFLDGGGARVGYHVVPPSHTWDRLDRVESVLMPYPMLKAIVATLAEPRH